jgi:hypothetical protein
MISVRLNTVHSLSSVFILFFFLSVCPAVFLGVLRGGWGLSVQ